MGKVSQGAWAPVVPRQQREVQGETRRVESNPVVFVSTRTEGHMPVLEGVRAAVRREGANVHELPSYAFIAL